jgi:E3 ubiquitin-protein ligase makorin
VINSTAVVVGAARPISPDTARKRQFVRLQMEASHGKECGICMELVLPKGKQFGLLDGCAHIFCVECIREWRSVNTLDKQVKRSCPLCRCSSHYVIPSSFVPPDDASKAEIIATYHERLTKIPCRHFNFGAGECPFGTSCFYEHRYRDGSLQQATAPRLKMTEDGEVEAVKKMSLSDMFDSQSVEQGAQGRRRR